MGRNVEKITMDRQEASLPRDLKRYRQLALDIGKDESYFRNARVAAAAVLIYGENHIFFSALRYTFFLEHRRVKHLANLTITVDEESLRQARLRARQEGTPVNALLRDFLDSYADVRREQQQAVGRLVALSRSSKSRRGGRIWTRVDLHA